jgi:Leucine-rich repeat (LRR) protein
MQKYKKISKLFLSHNYLFTLEGIELFKGLTHLSISQNKIQDIEELSRIQEPIYLECLAVKGNYIDKNPDYKSLIIQFFPNLKELDSLQIN